MPYDFTDSSETPKSSEQDRNIVPNCKTNLTTTSRAFGRWIAEKNKEWSDDKQAKAERALLALRSLEQRNTSPAFESAAKADIQAFLAA